MRRFLEFQGERLYFDDPTEQAVIVSPKEFAALQLIEYRWDDRMFQNLMNNLWGNNPGELDRWADDGGPVP